MQYLPEFRLRAFLNTVLVFHQRIWDVLELIYNNRYSVFLQGPFKVLPVPPQYHDVHIDTTIDDIHQTLRPVASQPLSTSQREIYSNIIGNLLQRQTSVAERTPSHVSSADVVHLSFHSIAVHCECTQVAYHSLHPNSEVSDYIGLSEPPCFACNACIAAHSRIIPAHDTSRIRFRTKLPDRFESFPWAFPSLQPSTVNDLIRQRMISDFLRPALVRYVDDMRERISESNREPGPNFGVTRSEFLEILGKLFLHLPFCFILNMTINFSQRQICVLKCGLLKTES